MKLFLITILSLFVFSQSSFAYRDTTYSCKNSNPELPNNTYKIETVRLGSASLPYLEVTRYVKVADQARALTARGIASVQSTRPNSEVLQLENLRIEFVDGEFFNCKQ